MTTALTDTQPRRLQTGDDGGWFCTLCDRAYPGEPPPIEHRFIMSPPPELVCFCDADHHAAATWHKFVCVNRRGICIVGMVCGPCVGDPGLAVAVQTAITRAIGAALHIN